MSEHHRVPDDDLTQPARQGDVPDWFTTSEASQPVINPDDRVEPKPGAPIALPASTSPPDPAAGEQPPDAEQPEASGDVRLVPPVGPRRRPISAYSVCLSPSGTLAAAPSGRGYACAHADTAIVFHP